MDKAIQIFSLAMVIASGCLLFAMLCTTVPEELLVAPVLLLGFMGVTFGLLGLCFTIINHRPAAAQEKGNNEPPSNDQRQS